MCTRVYVSGHVSLWACGPEYVLPNQTSACVRYNESKHGNRTNSGLNVTIPIENTTNSGLNVTIPIENTTNSGLNVTIPIENTTNSGLNVTIPIENTTNSGLNATIPTNYNDSESNRNNTTEYIPTTSKVTCFCTDRSTNRTVVNFTLASATNSSNHTEDSHPSQPADLSALHVLWTIPISLLLLVVRWKRKNTKIKHWHLERVRSKSWQGPLREKTPMNTRWKSSPAFEKSGP